MRSTGPSGMLAARDYAHDKGMRFGLYWNCNPPMTTAEGMQHRQDDAKYLYEKFQIDFFRTDGTDGNVLQTGGYGPGTRANCAEDVGYWQTKGYYEVLDWLYAEMPNFSYENCSGGGRIKDYGILRRCIQDPEPGPLLPVGRPAVVLRFVLCAASDADWRPCSGPGPSGRPPVRSTSSVRRRWAPPTGTPTRPSGGNGGPVWSARAEGRRQDRP